MSLRLTIASVLFVTNSFGQSKVRLPLWTFNTKNTNIYGLSLGYMPSKKIENVTSNGIRFEALGFGILLPFMPDVPISQKDSLHSLIDPKKYAERVNGINVSAIGHGCDCKVNGLNIYGIGSVTGQVNGISAAIFMNITETQKGLQIGAFNWTYNLTGVQLALMGSINYGTTKGLQIGATNWTNDLKGVQIGLFNKTTKIRGLQIGLWNVNEKRKRPIINF